MSHPDKTAVTLDLLSRIPDAVSLEVALTTWWINQRNTGGLRLTAVGHQYLLLNGIAHHSLDIDRELLKKPATLLTLDRHINGPYYLDTKIRRLVLFSSEQAIMAELYQDMEKFLRFLSESD